MRTLSSTRLSLAVLLALGLAASPSPAHAAGAATPVPAARPVAMAAPAATVEPAEAARQLMDFAEARFPGYFPPGAATQSAGDIHYRAYADTGMALGVVVGSGTPYVANGVYVVGGEYGATPLYVGKLSEFITPVADFGLTLSAAKTTVLQGASTTLRATLTRRNGFNGAVQLVLDGLPPGVTSPAATIPAGASSADLVLTAQGSAPHSLPTVARLRAIAGNDTLHQPLTVTVRGLPGSIDTSHGGGIVTTPVGVGEDYGHAVAVQADGKILVAGASTTSTGTAVSLLRYGRDGGLDTGFGIGGKVVTQVGPRSDVAQAVAVQADGKIVVAGSTDQNGTGLDMLVLRYNANGSLDTSFGNGGKVVSAVGADTDRAFAVAIQADGKIVVAGETQSGAGTTGVDFALLRLLPGGALDNGFGTNGRVVTALKPHAGRDTVYALALPQVAGEQRILAVGGEGDFLAARYTANGSLDAGFGEGGKVVGLFNANIGAARAVVLLPGGQAVLAGGINNDFAAAQLSPGGTLDPSFGTGGRFVQGVVPTNWDAATAIVRLADGSLLLGGWAYAGNSSSGDFAALRLLANGTLDTRFGQGGIVIHPTATGTKSDQAHGLALQADERVPTVRAIQAGEANGSNNDIALIRLWL
ncbi:MAG: hypothetical protein HY855_09730 [Burkholderiales bacterium]|nr:hypothetical protein [Burkholderiales bacterium]